MENNKIITEQEIFKVLKSNRGTIKRLEEKYDEVKK